MDFKELTLIYFSPTHTTRKVLEAIAEGTGIQTINIIDMTRPENRKKEMQLSKDSLVLMGAPVYAGRVAKDAADSFKQIKAAGNPAVLTVLYGNREFEDALLELKDIAQECGCIPIAGSAFIGEHSFSHKALPVAENRPDGKDLGIASGFGKQIADQIKVLDNLEGLTPVAVPGNSPYKDGMGAGAFQFIEVSEACDACGSCVEACPKEAIDEENHYAIIEDRCIFCCACIKACPNEARSMKEGPMLEKAKWLYENCSTRKEPELFIE